MKSLVELAVFVRVVESKNLSGAARALGITPSAVSKRLSKLEERLGVTLIHRTTRNISLSEDGRVFYERCKRILADVSEAERALVSGKDEVRGTVRVALPCTVARQVLITRLPALLSTNPELTIDLTLTDDDVDPMRDSVDIAVGWGRPPDSSLLQRKLTASKVRVYAAPGYLSRRGVPKTLDALAGHDCLVDARHDRGWVFKHGSREVEVPVKSRVHCSSTDVVRELAVAGLGLAWEPELLMASAQKAGELRTVLDDFVAPDLPLFARCVPAQPMATRVRVVMDWLVTAFAS